MWFYTGEKTCGKSTQAPQNEIFVCEEHQIKPGCERSADLLVSTINCLRVLGFPSAPGGLAAVAPQPSADNLPPTITSKRLTLRRAPNSPRHGAGSARCSPASLFWLTFAFVEKLFLVIQHVQPCTYPICLTGFGYKWVFSHVNKCSGGKLRAGRPENDPLPGISLRHWVFFVNQVQNKKAFCLAKTHH